MNTLYRVIRGKRGNMKMKIGKGILLILIIIGLPVIGIAAILAYALCKAADRKPPVDYEE